MKVGWRKWKDIEGYEGLYQVSRFGEVKALEKYPSKGHHYFEKILKKNTNRGYWVVGLYKDSILKGKSVHRLVAQAFIPNPENKPEVNHKDGNRKNNYYKNLEWSTESENKMHAHYVLNKDVMAIKAISPSGKELFFKSQREASRKLNIKHSSICNTVNNKRKTAGGYKFIKQ